MHTTNFYINIIKNRESLFNNEIKPEFSINNKNHDETILPLSVQANYKKRFFEFTEKDELAPNYFIYFTGGLYLVSNTIFTDVYVKTYRKYMRDHKYTNYDEMDFLLVNKSTKLDYKQICLHKFKSLFELEIYTIFKKINFCREEVLIISNTLSALHSLKYYKKYFLYQNNVYIEKNVKNFVQLYNDTLGKKEFPDSYQKQLEHQIEEIKQEKVCTVIPQELHNENIDKILASETKTYSDILINIPLLIDFSYYLVSNNGQIQMLISALIIGLHYLEENGNMIIYHSIITNKLHLNLIIYISLIFDSFYFANIDQITNMNNTQVIVFEKYNKKKSQIVIQKLREVNEMMYKNDPSGGNNYKLSDTEEIRAYDMENYKSDDSYKYLVNLVNFEDNNTLDKIYKKYKKYAIHIFEKKYNVIDQSEKLLSKNTDIEHVKYLLNLNKLKAIDYSKKYNINIVDWVDIGAAKEYFNESLLKYYVQMNLYYIKKIPVYDRNIIMKESKTVDSPYFKKFELWSVLSENAYEITEKVNKDKFKIVELFFNSRQKDLNNFLYKKYKININGRGISRAWIKMQELLYTTKFFDNITEYAKNNNLTTIKSFHICEAPGNFINSCMYYVKSNTKLNYDWKAQSLQDSKIYDQYGFIKNNPERWDFHKGGDITNYENLLYYYKKYENSDVLISDCGTEWIQNDDLKLIVNLSAYEMIYCLLIPRVGGNFIMKTIASNYNKHFIVLVYLATIKFEKVYIFKSNNNFWSQEIYIVGINNLGFSNDEKNVLLNIAKGLSNHEVIYPVDNISNEFCIFYNEIMNNILEQFKNIKKLFTFLIDYEELFEDNNKYLSKLVYRKNASWLKKFMKHISYAYEEYIQSNKI